MNFGCFLRKKTLCLLSVDETKEKNIMEDNVILDKSYNFARRILKLSRFLETEKKERTLSKQLLRSGTSIGANAVEAANAQSKADFFAKMYISYKEANETEYWLRLFHDDGLIDDKGYESIHNDCLELVKILSAITRHYKEK